MADWTICHCILRPFALLVHAIRCFTWPLLAFALFPLFHPCGSCVQTSNGHMACLCAFVRANLSLANSQSHCLQDAGLIPCYNSFQQKWSIVEHAQIPAQRLVGLHHRPMIGFKVTLSEQVRVSSSQLAHCTQHGMSKMSPGIPAQRVIIPQSMTCACLDAGPKCACAGSSRPKPHGGKARIHHPSAS